MALKALNATMKSIVDEEESWKIEKPNSPKENLQVTAEVEQFIKQRSGGVLVAPKSDVTLYGNDSVCSRVCSCWNQTDPPIGITHANVSECLPSLWITCTTTRGMQGIVGRA